MQVSQSVIYYMIVKLIDVNGNVFFLCINFLFVVLHQNKCRLRECAWQNGKL